ncbi:MAG: 1-acyl-sn-glycerol-3-phosphate acyltransferase [Gemmatimonadota bacterium]|nr:MAG: 1-acyl-sn-glycerol-3-phosphate acyltransferase [Gemmatimonadota bacterium]
MGARSGIKRFIRFVGSQARGRPGWLSNIIWHITSYLVVNITVTFASLFFFVLNRTTVSGRKYVGEEPNTLLLSNHQSMIDSMPIGIGAYYPKSWFKPYLVAWHPAARENFFRNRLIAWFSSHSRCIPVRPGRRDLHALHKMIEVLPQGTVILFPEGTRSRTGDVEEGRPGAGLLILATRPRVIPVAIDGMREVLPIGKIIPRIGKRIYIRYGPPLDYSEFLERPRTRETAQAIVDKVIEAITAQHAEIRQRRTKGGRKA